MRSRSAIMRSSSPFSASASASAPDRTHPSAARRRHSNCSPSAAARRGGPPALGAGHRPGAGLAGDGEMLRRPRPACGRRPRRILAWTHPRPPAPEARRSPGSLLEPRHLLGEANRLPASSRCSLESSSARVTVSSSAPRPSCACPHPPCAPGSGVPLAVGSHFSAPGAERRAIPRQPGPPSSPSPAPDRSRRQAGRVGKRVESACAAVTASRETAISGSRSARRSEYANRSIRAARSHRRRASAALADHGQALGGDRRRPGCLGVLAELLDRLAAGRGRRPHRRARFPAPELDLNLGQPVARISRSAAAAPPDSAMKHPSAACGHRESPAAARSPNPGHILFGDADLCHPPRQLWRSRGMSCQWLEPGASADRRPVLLPAQRRARPPSAASRSSPMPPPVPAHSRLGANIGQRRAAALRQRLGQSLAL